MLFQALTRSFQPRQLVRMVLGFVYTIIGLILFLTGVNVGFAPVGNLLGSGLGSGPLRWALLPIGMLIGYYIVKAEPAVQVLNEQVEEITGWHHLPPCHEPRPAGRCGRGGGAGHAARADRT